MIALFLLNVDAAVTAPPPATAAFAQAEREQEMWQLEQLRLAPETDPKVLKALEPDHSLDAVAARLTKLGVAFRRTRIAVYPDALPPQLRDALLGLPKGEPFVLREPQFWSVSVLAGRRLPASTVLNLSVPKREA